ncbi:MAG: hypothetical protein AAF628_36880 [Planctomycetota bacterium]
MICWVLAFYVPFGLLVLDGWLAHLLLEVPVLTLALCMFLALQARASAVPGLLVCTALARSVLVGGDAALHVLTLGLPVAALVPLRGVFFFGHLLWQAAAAAFLVLALPVAAALIARLVDDAPPIAGVGGAQLACAILCVPPATWLLGALPPFSLLREVSE